MTAISNQISSAGGFHSLSVLDGGPTPKPESKGKWSAAPEAFKKLGDLQRSFPSPSPTASQTQGDGQARWRQQKDKDGNEIPPPPGFFAELPATPPPGLITKYGAIHAPNSVTPADALSSGASHASIEEGITVAGLLIGTGAALATAAAFVLGGLTGGAATP